MSKGRRLTDGMELVVLAEKFHWDYWQIKQQPLWFIALIFKKMEIDDKLEEQERRKQQ